MLRSPPGYGDQSQRRSVTEAREELEGGQRGIGQTSEPFPHEIGDVFGDAPGGDALLVPAPGVRRVVEGEQSPVGEGCQELTDEERIAARLGRDEPCEAADPLGRRVERVRQELGDIRGCQRLEPQVFGRRRGTDGRKGPGEGMRGVDLVVAVGADQEEVTNLRRCGEPFDQLDRTGVEPLDVVEEQDQRLFGPGEDREEALEDPVEPVLGVGWR